jgi:hypothetical protein
MLYHPSDSLEFNHELSLVTREVKDVAEKVVVGQKDYGCSEREHYCQSPQQNKDREVSRFADGERREIESY